MNTPSNFKEQFINLKDKLETSNFTITEFNLGNAVEETTIELIESAIQCALPNEIKQFALTLKTDTNYNKRTEKENTNANAS